MFSSSSARRSDYSRKADSMHEVFLAAGPPWTPAKLRVYIMEGKLKALQGRPSEGCIFIILFAVTLKSISLEGKPTAEVTGTRDEGRMMGG